MRKSFFLVIIMAILGACKTTYVISVEKDGKAFVEQNVIRLYDQDILAIDSTLKEEAEMVGGEPEFSYTVSEKMVASFKDNPTIKLFKYKTTREIYYDASYQITDIDSLGAYINKSDHYLDPVFQFSPESFTLTCPPGTEENIDPSTIGAIFVEMTFNFPYDIKSVVCDENLVKWEQSKRQLFLKFKVKDLFYATSSTVLSVSFE